MDALSSASQCSRNLTLLTAHCALLYASMTSGAAFGGSSAGKSPGRSSLGNSCELYRMPVATPACEKAVLVLVFVFVFVLVLVLLRPRRPMAPSSGRGS